ncbi:MAG: 50S ribosomal protein L10 [Candidatus Improbicoccus devescovinae]|nr:MAG: 50S ribosomal protein L10 [Candidatus Improbicoccus devescovinae]
MPSIKNLAKKKAKVVEISSEFKQSIVGVLVSYKGINVDSDTVLRKQMRESNIIYKVVKNTLLKRAFDISGISGLDYVLKGSTAIALSKDSYSSVARIVCDFAKKNDYYKIKAGFVEGNAIDLNEVLALAKLPEKEELVAQVLRGLNTPIVSLVMVLNGIIRSFAIVINEISQKKSQ